MCNGRIIRKFIKNNGPQIDGYIHLFERRGILQSGVPNKFVKSVCFVDIVFSKFVPLSDSNTQRLFKI